MENNDELINKDPFPSQPLSDIGNSYDDLADNCDVEDDPRWRIQNNGSQDYDDDMGTKSSSEIFKDSSVAMSPMSMPPPPEDLSDIELFSDNDSLKNYDVIEMDNFIKASDEEVRLLTTQERKSLTDQILTPNFRNSQPLSQSSTYSEIEAAPRVNPFYSSQESTVSHRSTDMYIDLSSQPNSQELPEEEDKEEEEEEKEEEEELKEEEAKQKPYPHCYVIADDDENDRDDLTAARLTDQMSLKRKEPEIPNRKEAVPLTRLRESKISRKTDLVKVASKTSLVTTDYNSKPKTSRPRGRILSSFDDEAASSQPLSKKEKKKEQNKIAAQKYREKKKQEEEDLQNIWSTLNQQYNGLFSEYTELLAKRKKLIEFIQNLSPKES